MLNFFPVALAYADNGASAGGTAGAWGMVPMLVVFGLIFYFLILRPQQKNAKEHKKLVSSLQKGDSIILSCGIHGRISAITDDTVTVEVADNVRIKVNKDVVHIRKAQA